MKALLIPIFLLLVAFPAQAQTGTMFTVYGQVFNTDGTPVNGVTVYLTASGSTISAITTTAERTNGSLVNGYYLLELANLPNAVSAGTSMTLSASYGSVSASTTVARAATEPQKVDLYLSTGGGGGSGGSSSSGGGSGGGGGGGGASGENYTNIEARESREEFIVKDLPTVYNFTTEGLPVYGIVITGSTNAGLIAVQIELLRNTSTLVKEASPEIVYKNVNIWVGTAGFAIPKNIKEAIIKFKVKNSWITSNSLKDTEIVMFRWDGTQWVKLETQLKYNDDGFTHYEAKTNAFSPFAIVGLKGIAVPTVTLDAGTPSKPGGTAAPTPVISKGSIVTGILVIILAAA